jgi:ribosomal protein S10
MKQGYKIKILTSNIKSFIIVENTLRKISPSFKIVFLPTKRKRFVLLKSPHVNKKSKEHFQFLRYQRLYYVSFSSLILIKEFLLKVPNDLNIILKKII